MIALGYQLGLAIGLEAASSIDGLASVEQELVFTVLGAIPPASMAEDYGTTDTFLPRGGRRRRRRRTVMDP